MSNAPTILDYIMKLQGPEIDYRNPDPNTLAAYIKEKHERDESMDEEEIWATFREIVVQVIEKCTEGSWSGEFSEGINPVEANV